MAFTATDVTNLEAAIMKLANGARVVECNIDGDMVQYHGSDLKSMMALLSDIKAQIAAASSTATRGRTRVAVTTKGY